MIVNQNVFPSVPVSEVVLDSCDADRGCQCFVGGTFWLIGRGDGFRQNCSGLIVRARTTLWATLTYYFDVITTWLRLMSVRYTLLCLAVPLWCVGCDLSRPADSNASAPLPPPALVALGAPRGSAVLAQGQLRPAGGIVTISAQPGDRIESISVRAGDAVAVGDVLVRLQSAEIGRAELTIAETELREAQSAAELAMRVAESELAVAEVSLRVAQTQLRHASDRRESLQAPDQLSPQNSTAGDNATPGGQSLLQKRISFATQKLTALKQAAADPTVGDLVSESAINEQALAIDVMRAEQIAVRNAAEQQWVLAELSLDQATKQVEAAKAAVESRPAGLESIRKRIELIRLRAGRSVLVSPIDGVVLSVSGNSGEATTGSAILQVANLDRMTCAAEVNVADLARIQLGAVASLVGTGVRPMSGTVVAISPVVGTPQLSRPNPLQPVDWRQAEVTIAIDAADADAARGFVHFQVDVAIVATDSAASRVSLGGVPSAEISAARSSTNVAPATADLP